MRILIVDDEEELLKAMRIRLSSWGYDVITATNGKEAIQFVKKELPDVVILDIMMPEMDGIQTLRRIRRFNKKLPVLMFTAYATEERMRVSDKLGISGFIPKISESADASKTIKTILRGVKSPTKNQKSKLSMFEGPLA